MKIIFTPGVTSNVQTESPRNHCWVTVSINSYPWAVPQTETYLGLKIFLSLIQTYNLMDISPLTAQAVWL
jgi:hypothetical protein